MNSYRRYAGLTIIILLVQLLLAGCQSVPKDALRLSPDSAKKRSLQTRKYQSISEAELLSASAAVIQDLGFNLDESETDLGLIVGSKERDAAETGEIITIVVASLIFGAVPTWDDTQKLRISLAIRPVPGGQANEHYVRVTFQRIVWNNEKQISRIESLDQPAIYTEFFDRLSKAIFLEGHEI